MFISATAMAVITAILLVGADAAVTLGIVDETASQTEVEWGPLAVVSEGSTPDAGLGPGTLSISAACVTFKADDTRPGDAGITLVWPADRTSWRPDDRQVVFAQPVNGATHFSDGDRVLFVGQALAGDSPDGPEDVAAGPEESWVQRPDPSCPTAMWHVGDVRRPSAEGINATSDLRAGAKADGWTIEEAKLQQKASRAVGRVSTAIYRQQRDIWIGSALSRDPGGAPSLYIKGPAPRFVRDLVAEADYLIAIVDEQPYSFDELEERSMRVQQALVEAGYPDVSTGTNISGGGVIPSWLLQVGDLPAEPAEILALLPEDLRADVDLHVTIAPARPSAEPETWGPLAVLYRPQGFGAGVGLDTVTLHIDEACVWIEHARSGWTATLAWEGNHVDWRPANRRIVFTDRKGKTVSLSDGDRIEGGGSGLWPEEGPEGQDEATLPPEPGPRWGASLDDAWLHEPDPSCPGSLFYLDEVTVE